MTTTKSATKAALIMLLNEQNKEIADLRRQIKEAGWALESEQVRWTQLATESNAIYGMLGELFNLKVYSAHVANSDWRAEPLWTVEDAESGEVLVESCKPLAAAYYEAIQRRLERTRQ